MALQAPGGSPPTNPISFTQIAAEFGHLNNTLGNYRRVQSIPGSGLGNLPLDEGIPTSGTISFSDFYSKRLNIVVDCFTGSEETTTNAKTEKWDNNLITVIGNFGKSKKEVGSKIIVAVNKTFKSEKDQTPQKCALRTGTWNSSAQIVVEVRANGKIYGAGGNGGRGGWNSGRRNSDGSDAQVPGAPGGEGGGALGVELNGTVVNVRSGGLILAGGGGGGGGGGQRETSGWGARDGSGGGGGGGLGFPPGKGGAGGGQSRAGQSGNAGGAITGIGAVTSVGPYNSGNSGYFRKVASTTPGRADEGGNNDAFFEVTVDGNGNISSLIIARRFTRERSSYYARDTKFGGQNYQVGQTVIIPGSSLGGSTDVSFNITSIGGGFGGKGGENGGQAYGAIGGQGGNYGAIGEAGRNGNVFDRHGRATPTGLGGAGGSAGGAIRRAAGTSITINNNGTITGSTNQTGVQ